MEAMGSFAKVQRDEWLRRTWEEGKHPSTDLLIELRTRADAYRAIPDSTYDDWMKAHGNDPQPE
ncbi:hypothetical protein [Sphingomonas melonis]|nr:hypothetical protein [Sphingomonas melonis]